MDHKRNLLLAALALVSYFLLLAWSKDNSPQPNALATPSAVAQSTAVPSQSAAPATSVDLPTAANPDAKAASTTTEALATAPSFVTVSTPLQQVKIDTTGGDIVALALPKYSVSLDTPEVGFPLLKNDSGVFIAQSGLVGPNGLDASSKGRPHYTAAQSEYSIESGELVVDLVAATDDGVQVTKRFIFSASDYLIRQQFIIQNNSTAEWRGNVFGQIKRDSSKDPSGQSGVRLSNFLGAALTSADEPYIKIKQEDIGAKREPIDTTGGWIAFSQHYFLTAWIPAAELNRFTVRNNDKGEHLLGYVGPEHTVAPGQTLMLESALWAGPKSQDRLEQVAKNLGLTIDYGKLWFVAYPIFQLLSWLNALVGNFGVAIILLTIIMRSLFYPIAAKQFASSAGMKRLQPKLEQLKAQYADDSMKLQQATLELWKKEGVNPLAGCLPIFLQMPVFLGIYWVLNESVELRHAPFMLWYHDLSALDSYFLLPLLLGAVNYIQQQLTPMPTSDPMQAKMMKFMPVIFTVFFLWMPAGLVLYYFVNSLLVIMQQSFFNLRHKHATAKTTN